MHCKSQKKSYSKKQKAKVLKKNLKKLRHHLSKHYLRDFHQVQNFFENLLYILSSELELKPSRL